MTDRRKSLLSRILPDCVDLVDDSMAKKALLKSKKYLFGKKFRKILTNDGKDFKELYEMIPQRKRVPEKNVYFGQKSHYSSENKQQRKIGSASSSSNRQQDRYDVYKQNGGEPNPLNAIKLPSISGNGVFKET